MGSRRNKSGKALRKKKKKKVERMKFFQTFGCIFELTMTRIFAPFMATLLFGGKCLYRSQNKSCDYRRVAKSSTAKFKTDFGGHRAATNTVF